MVYIYKSSESQSPYSIGHSYCTSKYGLKDNKGNIIVPAQYDGIEPFVNGFAPIRIDKKWGFVSDNGVEILSPVCDKVENFENGRAKVYKNNKVTFINEKGWTIIPYKYNQIGDFYKGMAPARLDNKWYLLDKNLIEVKSLDINGIQEILCYDDGYTLSYNYYSGYDESDPCYEYKVFGPSNEYICGTESSNRQTFKTPKELIAQTYLRSPQQINTILTSPSLPDVVNIAKTAIVEYYKKQIAMASQSNQITQMTNEAKAKIQILDDALNNASKAISEKQNLSKLKDSASDELNNLL